MRKDFDEWLLAQAPDQRDVLTKAYEIGVRHAAKAALDGLDDFVQALRRS